MAKILLVEDEANIASFIERGLLEFGHEVTVAANGEQGWERLMAETFQLLVLDIVVPKINGLDLCRMYRDKFGYATPVIMLTALGTTEDIVHGLDAGADDYIVKPFRFVELEARIRAMLRRSGVEQSTVTLSCGDLSLDPDNRRAIRKGKAIPLTTKEYRMLEYLMIHKGTAVKREDLLHHVWEEKEFDRSTNVVDVYVNYLRGKIEKGFKRKMIRTVSGVGYMIEE